MSDTAMKLYISNLQKSLELIDSVFIPVVKSFDGKVFNKRLKNKLEEEIHKVENGLYVNVDFDNFKCEFTLLFYGLNLRSYRVPNYDGNFYLANGYEKVVVCNTYSDYNRYYPEKNNAYFARNEHHFWIDNGYLRINADCIIKVLLKYFEIISEQIDTLSICMKHVSEYKSRFKTIKEELDKFNEEVPSTIRQFYDIKSYASWS